MGKNKIENYAEALKDRLQIVLGNAVPHYFALNVLYSKEQIAEKEWDAHYFAIREGDGFLNKHIGPLILYGIYFDVHTLGAGKHIYVARKPQLELIQREVKRLNAERGIDFVVRLDSDREGGRGLLKRMLAAAP